MKIAFRKSSAEAPRGDLVVVPVAPGAKKKELRGQKGTKKEKATFAESPALRALDKRCHGALIEFLKRSEFSGKNLETALLPVFGVPGITTVLCVGWKQAEDNRDFDTIENYRRLGSIITRQAQAVKAADAVLADGAIDLRAAEQIEALLEGVLLTPYSFDRYKSGAQTSPTELKSFTITTPRALSPQAVSAVETMCAATKLARDLVNTPPRDCTPQTLVDESRKVARAGKLRFQLYTKAQLQRMGANALLAVAQGSDQPPFLIKMTYRPSRKPKKVIAIIGKGITFDSGGLSIKTAGGMETMKIDMSGAAAVIAAMKAIAVLKPRVEVRGYVPTCENMINGSATKPGDVVKAMNGKSIEIVNTDAEGRLILSDAISLAVKEKCDQIIDLATLTGACAVALGPLYGGLFCRNDRLTADLIRAAELSGERLWPLPLAAEYMELIKTPIADLRNQGRGGYGGAITAALFLQEFTGKIPWAHLDIAGPAMTDSDSYHVRRGGVGFGVRTLIRYLVGA